MAFSSGIYILLATLFMSNLIYGLAAPFLPNEMAELKIESYWTGIIFSAYAVASIAASIGVGSKLEKIGHVRAVATGTLMMGATTVSFGFLGFLTEDQKYIFIVAAMLLRLFQGK